MALTVISIALGFRELQAAITGSEHREWSISMGAWRDRRSSRARRFKLVFRIAQSEQYSALDLYRDDRPRRFDDALWTVRHAV